MSNRDLPSPSSVERLLTVPEVAQKLNLSTRTVWRLIDDGRLSCVRIGRSVRIEPQALRSLVGRS